MSIEKYIQITLRGSSKSGLTCVWSVDNIHHQERCGEIKWHGAFRKYCFYPTDGFLFDSACMRKIADFLDEKNAAKRKKV